MKPLHAEADASFKAMIEAEQSYHTVVCEMIQGKLNIHTDAAIDPLPALLEETNRAASLPAYYRRLDRWHDVIRSKTKVVPSKVAVA